MPDDTISPAAEPTAEPKRPKHTTPASPFLRENYLTISDFAAMIGRTERWVYRCMAEGAAPPITRVGNRVLFRKAAVEKWLLSLEQRRA